MRNKLLTSLLCSVVFISANACSSGQFSGEKEKKDDGSDKEKSSGDDESASDPVMVGGAYLACAFVSQPASDGSAEIGCALNDKDSGEKKDLSGYNPKWVISENSNDVNVDSSEGSPNDPYHQKFNYTNDAYKRQNLRLEVSKNGQPYTYRRDLLHLDKSLRATNLSVNYSLTYSAYVSSSATATGCSLTNDAGCMTSLLTNIASAVIGFCKSNGQPENGLTLSLLKGTPTILPSPVILNPRQAGVCAAVSGIRVEPNGCIIVPFVASASELKYYIVPPQTIPAGIVQQMLQPHSCP